MFVLYDVRFILKNIVAIYEYVVAYVSTVLPYIGDTNKLNGYLVLSLMPLIYHAVNVTHIR